MKSRFNPGPAPLANRRTKAAKIRAVLADNLDATAKEVIKALAVQGVRLPHSRARAMWHQNP